MATYTTSAFTDPAYSFPTAGVYKARVKHTLTAVLDNATSDVLKIVSLPKGACIVPEDCAVFADADPDSDNDATVALKITDGTTTKTIISAATFQAADTRIVASAADITGLGFFKTSNDDFYAYIDLGAGDLTSGAVLYFVIAYTMIGGRSESTT